MDNRERKLDYTRDGLESLPMPGLWRIASKFGLGRNKSKSDLINEILKAQSNLNHTGSERSVILRTASPDSHDVSISNQHQYAPNTRLTPPTGPRRQKPKIRAVCNLCDKTWNPESPIVFESRDFIEAYSAQGMSVASGQESEQVETKRKREERGSKVPKATLLTVSTAILAAAATIWRQEKLRTGYCGIGEQTKFSVGFAIPEWASFIQPQCEACPQHAYCYPDLVTVCEPDYTLNPHPLSAGGLNPLPPTCGPDNDVSQS